jgi:hypothetical protein
MFHILKRNFHFKNVKSLGVIKHLPNLDSLNSLKRMTFLNNHLNKKFTTKENPKEQQDEEKVEDEPQNETKANYKTSRRIRIILGKLLKYFFIFGGLLTIYNGYLYRKKENPKEHYMYNKFSFKIVQKIGFFWKLIYGVR